MQLTQTELSVYRQQVNLKNCSICRQALHLTLADKFICTKGLRFPFCKGHKNGFSEKT